MPAQAVKTFTVKRAGEPLPPRPFQIEFTREDGGESVVHEFVIHAEAPAGFTLILASVVRIDARGREQVDLNGMSTFFEAAMPPADFRRFRACIEDPELVVPMDTLADIFQWAIEVYAERPTTPSPSSSDGRRPTGRTSKATQPSEA